jgi:hypothetical protein
MPSRSKSQFRLMAAAANNPKFAAKAGVPLKVAKEFHAADRSKLYKKMPEKMNERRRASTPSD